LGRDVACGTRCGGLGHSFVSLGHPVSQICPWCQHETMDRSQAVTCQTKGHAKGDGNGIVSVLVGGAYIYFMSTSSASVPPGELYIWLNIGDISAWRMDWRISVTVAKWTSCGVVRHKSAQSPFLCACARQARWVPVSGSPAPNATGAWPRERPVRERRRRPRSACLPGSAVCVAGETR
jgi:hypothetical protein